MLTRRRIILGTLIAFTLAAAGFYYWLGTGPAKRRVLAAIARTYRGHVDVDRVDWRLNGGLIIRGLRLFESPEPDSAVICEVRRIELKGSLWHAVADDFRPTEVIAHKAVVRGKLDSAGKLILPPLVSMPQTIPPAIQVPIRFHDAQVELYAPSAGRSASYRLSGVAIQVDPMTDGSGYQISGQIRDPLWSNWQIEGHVDAAVSRLRARFVAPEIDVRAEHFAGLTAGVRDACRALQPAGRVAADLSIVWDRSSDVSWDYQLLLDPRNLSLQVPTLADRVRDITGRVEITPGSLRIHGLSGAIAGGQAIAAGTITRASEPRFEFELSVRRLAISQVVAEAIEHLVDPSDSITGQLRLEGSGDPGSWRGEFEGGVQWAASGSADVLPILVSVGDGRVRFQDLRVRFCGGHAVVSAELPIEPGATIGGTVVLEDILLRPLCEFFAPDAQPIDGVAGGELQFAVPVEHWQDQDAWNWTGSIRVDRPRFGDVAFDAIEGDLSCHARQLALKHATATLRGHRLQGTAELALAAPFPVHVRFQADRKDLAATAGTATAPSPLAIRGGVELRGSLAGSLQPLDLKLTGITRILDATLGSHRLPNAVATYTLAGNGIDFKLAELQAWSGTVRVQGRWEWPADPPPAESDPGAAEPPDRGHVRVQVEFDSIDAAALEPVRTQRLPVAGRLHGRVHIEFPVGAGNALEQLDFSGDIGSDHLTLWNLPLQEVRGSFRYRDASIQVPQWSAALDAAPLSGTAHVRSVLDSPVIDVHMVGTNLELARLIEAAEGSSRPDPVRGAVAGQCELRWDTGTGSVTGHGSARVEQLQIPELPPIERVASRDFELNQRRLTFRACRAELWGGEAHGTTVVLLDRDKAHAVEIAIDRFEKIDAARWPASSFLGKVLPRGILSGSGRVDVPRGKHSVSASADFKIDKAVVFGLPTQVTRAQLVAWDDATHELAGQAVAARAALPRKPASQPKVKIFVRDARAARGTIHGTALLTFAQPLYYDLDLKFSSLDLAILVPATLSNRYPVSGDFSGTMRLMGNDRGLEHARGEFTKLRVENGNLWHIPVVAVIVRESGKVLNRVFNRDPREGTQLAESARVTLSGGVLHTDEFRLWGDAGKLIGSGTVRLDGELELDVVGNFESSLARNLPILGSLQRAANLAQQRLVKFRITGTLDDPEAIPVPLQDLTEPAEKFLRGIVTGTIFDDRDKPPPLRR